MPEYVPKGGTVVVLALIAVACFLVAVVAGFWAWSFVFFLQMWVFLSFMISILVGLFCFFSAKNENKWEVGE